MTTARERRTAMLFGTRRVLPRQPHSAWTERLLHAIGANPTFTESVLGDLAEERAQVEDQNGSVAAGWWYLCEALRSVPHLMWNAVRHGGARGRARVATLLTVTVLVLTVASMALLFRNGPPARLVVDTQQGGDDGGLVLNTRHPVKLAVRALDADGHLLSSRNVRYEWMSGTRLSVSSQGVVTCARTGDARVRAKIGTVATTLLLHCRPVTDVQTAGITLLLGDSGQDLRFQALGPDRRPVEMLAGELSIEDSTIATLRGTHVSPVAPGETHITVSIGDAERDVYVSVYEPVHTFIGLRAEQSLVVAPVRLVPGDTIRWPLPVGQFDLQYDRVSDLQPIAAMAVDGPVMCMPDFGPAIDYVVCLVRGPGAWLRIAHPGTVPGAIAGNISLHRWQRVIAHPQVTPK
jgi:hypothetical protein